MTRIFSWLAFASALLPATPYAQETDVETVAERGTDPRHPTATVTVVTPDPTADLAAALDTAPGVHSRRTSFGQTAYATVRGSNARQVLVEYEGLRLNPPFGPGFDLGGAALWVDAVSVWRGAAATYRGSGALAGVLELHTAHPRRPQSRVEATTLVGSHESLAGRATASVANRAVSTRLGVGARSSAGDFEFTDNQGTTSSRINNDHQRLAAFGATEVRGELGWVRGAVLHDRGERGAPGVSEFQGQFADARLKDSQTAVALAVGTTGIIDTESWTVDGAVRAGAQIRDYKYNNPTPFLAGEPVEETSQSRTGMGLIELVGWGRSAVVRSAIDARLDAWEGDVVADRVTSGIGTSWEQMVGDVWTLVGAFRGELDSDGRTAALPAIGASAKLSPNWSLRGNVGRTFRAPNLDELYLDLESIRGNPLLVSERAWVADVGLELEATPIDLELVTFGRLVDDEILFLPVSAYLAEAQNIDGTYAAGAELAGTARVRPFTIEAAYTYTHARFRETDEPVPLQPEHAGRVRLAFTPAGWFEMWSAANVRGAITLDPFGNATDGVHAFWDAGIVTGTGAARLSVAARNILNDDTAVDSLQQPMPGRTFWASLRLRWEELQ